MLPLAGITVVALEQAIAAPFATRQLADLGARVIKIERPDSGDFARDYDAKVCGLSSQFVWANRSKESLTLDLKRPEATIILDRLLATADVFIQNLLPGATERALLPPVTISGVEPNMGAIPALGEHTAAILKDLGFDAAQIAAWKQAGVI
jgi:crotonobetainyl-CoA:carnitine CoA-transferase CaiB-like acyl-CoA transferase